MGVCGLLIGDTLRRPGRPNLFQGSSEQPISQDPEG